MSDPTATTGIQGRYVGTAVPRREDERLLRGQGRYIDDLPEPSGLLYIGFLRSSYAHAMVRSINADGAKALRGVTAVITGTDVAGWTQPMATPVPGDKKLLRYNMALDRVRYVGEPVAAVVATDPYVVEDALELIEVDYEALPTVVSISEALSEDGQRLYDYLPGNVVFEAKYSVPGTDEAFARAAHVFADTFSSTRLSGVAMETRGFLASFDKGQNKLTLWSTAHLPHKERWEVADALGLPEKNVRIISPDVGGSFGLKTVTHPEVVAGAAISRHLGRPVKWVQDRQEDLALMHGRDFQFRVELAVDDQGMILAVRNRPVVNVGAYPLWVTTAGLDAAGAGHHMMGPYKVPYYAYDAVSVVTNTAPTASYRGVAAPICTFAMESLLTRAAEQLKIDPVEIRKRNLITREDLPYTNAVGVTHDTASNVECLEQALERSGFIAFRQEKSGKPGPDGKLRGMGLACMADHTGQGTSITRMRGQASRWPGYDGALVKIEPDGKASVHLSVASQGQGHATVFAQLAADTLGLNIEDVTVESSDTANVPFGTGAGASRGAVVAGGAVIKACTRLAEKMKRIAGYQLEVSPEDISLSQGKASVNGVPGMSVTIETIAQTAYMIGMGDMPEGETIGLDALEFYDPPSSTYSMACHVAQVAVDPGTGLVTVERYYVVHDCGRVLNPQIVDGQVVGAIVQGIGAVLMEGARYSEDGQPVATTLLDYTIPTMLDVPEIVVDHIETPSTFTLGGMKGAGESGAVGVVPALILAVTDALSAYKPQITTMPLTPSNVLKLMGVVGTAS
ncbi:xanthine dehydrogenase family protein molybdopterin-binding subunit [Cupriavidus necator]|uniref:xanthine dehydrogenase family protein molybdopterin-binding subunit n=1 Tax=Cupriavidus necator TaxID=106590 RepID=UPI0005B49594|nr:xanthine dehydrogenase family protein molybdopterin-binding subunit [Cupriavidus necator]